MAQAPWYEGEEELHERRAGILKVPPRKGRRFDTGWIQRYQAYWSVFYGGIGYTFGHMNLWMMNDLTGIYPPGERGDGNDWVLVLDVKQAPARYLRNRSRGGERDR